MPEGGEGEAASPSTPSTAGSTAPLSPKSDSGAATTARPFGRFDSWTDERELSEAPVVPSQLQDLDLHDGDDAGDEQVTIEDGARQLVQSMSNWLIPRKESAGLVGKGDTFTTDGFILPNSGDYHLNGENARGRRGKRESENSQRIDVTFETAEISLKKEIKRQYLAVAVGCWGFLTITQSVSLIALRANTLSPVIIAVSIMAIAVLFYWKYVYKTLNLSFKRLWETPYPFALASAVLGSLAQRAMYEVYNRYDIGQLLITFFLIQAFYFILVASTFQNYIGKWQRFLNHRRLCFNALQTEREKAIQAALRRERKYMTKGLVNDFDIRDDDDDDDDHEGSGSYGMHSQSSTGGFGSSSVRPQRFDSTPMLD